MMLIWAWGVSSTFWQYAEKLITDKNIVSQIKLKIPTYKKNDLPIDLKKIPITKPGSRYLKWNLDLVLT